MRFWDPADNVLINDNNNENELLKDESDGILSLHNDGLNFINSADLIKRGNVMKEFQLDDKEKQGHMIQEFQNIVYFTKSRYSNYVRIVAAFMVLFVALALVTIIMIVERDIIISWHIDDTWRGWSFFGIKIIEAYQPGKMEPRTKCT